MSLRKYRLRTDLARYSHRMQQIQPSVGESEPIRKPSNYSRAQNLPFASIAVLVIIGTLFSLSMIWGGWTWSSWTYAFALVILIPLVILETQRKVIITGAAMIMLFFMVLIDAGMPGYLGYSTSDYSWYDNIAHFLGAFVLTMFLWAFMWWALSPTGPPNENGTRKFLLAISIMVTVAVVFEFTEYFSDLLFGWTNYHPGVDTVGDLIFDLAGIAAAAIIIGRHRVSALKRPFWHGSALAEA